MCCVTFKTAYKEIFNYSADHYKAERKGTILEKII